MSTVVKALTPKDRKLIEKLVIGGPEALVAEGMTPQDVNAFIARPEIRVALETINAEFNHQDVVQSLTRFAARRKLARLIPESVEVLEAALHGPAYEREIARDSAGNVYETVRTDMQGHPVIRIPEPTRNQLKAATEVLERTGVSSFDRLGERLPSMNLSTLLKQENVSDVTVEMDPALDTPEQQSLSREKVRTVIEHLSGRVEKARKGTTGGSLLDALTGKRPKKKKSAKKTAKRKKSPKKTAKKKPKKKKPEASKQAKKSPAKKKIRKLKLIRGKRSKT